MARNNIAHAQIMAEFYRWLQANEENKEIAGKHGLKAGQLEDNAAFETQFLTFITRL